MSVGHGRVVRAVAVACGLVVTAAACNGGDESSATTVDTSEATASTTSAPSTSAGSSVTTAPGTTATTPTTSSPSTSSTVAGVSTPSTVGVTSVPETPAAAVSAAVVTWQAAVQAAAGSGDLNALASPVAVEAFGALESFIGEPVVFHTLPSANADGTVSIEECLLTPVSETGALLLRGVVSADSSQVESLDFEDAFGGCVPADINAAVLAVYGDYSQAFDEFISPPNPDDPRIDELVTGTYRQFLGDLLTSMRDAGEELRGRPERGPLVVRFIATDQVLIGDCQVIPSDYGVYTIGSDRRTDRYPPVDAGQTDYLETTMSFEDGAWKVSGAAQEVNSPCADVASRAVVVLEAP